MSNDNPLRAYFRRPSIYFELPSRGKFYTASDVEIPPNGKLAVYPMTTADEMTIRNPDGLFNGDSTVQVIKSCVPGIKDPWKLNDMDLEAVVVAIRAASGDGKMEITTTCPSCSEETKFDVDLLRILADKRPIDYSAPLVVGDLSFAFRPLSYAESNQNGIDQFEIQRSVAFVDTIEDVDERNRQMKAGITRLNHMMLNIIAQTVESVTTPEVTVTDREHIREFLIQCDAKTHTAVKDHSVRLRKENDTPPLQIKCPHCEHQYEQLLVLNFTDFFE